MTILFYKNNDQIMVKRLFLICTLFFNLRIVLAQSYVFPTVGWQQGVVRHGDWTTGGQNWNAPIRCVGDTTISSQNYKIISQFGYNFFTKWENGQIYLINGNNTLLYDFNLQIGEAFYTYMNDYLIVDSIGTYILPNGVNVRLLRFYDFYFTERQITWIEGIGDNQRGFLYYHDFEGGSDLHICTHDSTGFLIYDNNYAAFNCDSILGITQTGINPTIKRNILNIFPNPFDTYVTIELGTNLFNEWKIRIDNAIGKTIFQEPINQRKFKLNFQNEYSSEMYFIYVFGKNNELIDSKKIIAK